MASKKTASKGQDTTPAPTAPDGPASETQDVVNTDDPGLFNGADPALFDHDGDGHAGGSLKQEPDSTVEQPTVGRVVHYYDNSAQEQPFAAMVTEVSQEFGLKLTVFRPNITIPLSSYTKHLSDLVADGPAWVWPPRSTGYASPAYANVGSLADKFPGATGSTVFGVPK